MSRQGFVTPGGQIVELEVVSEGRVHRHDAHQVTMEVTLPSGGVFLVETRFPTPPIINVNAKSHFDRAFDQEFARELAVLATLRSLDSDPEVGDGDRTISFDADDLLGLLTRPRMSDRDCRRYMARRLYAAYAADTLDTHVEFDQLDQLITGCRQLDFIRNAQLLEAEGIVIAHIAMGPTLSSVQPTARLVREVERWGTLKEDVSSAEEYSDQLTYPILGPHKDALLRERSRFLAARTTGELASVFRATAPIIEGIAREVLGALGSTKDLGTLGQIIGEFQSRSLGGVALMSQLTHILKFGRDLAEHGHEIPEPVLRIACENAFELAPQLAALAPR